MMHHSALPIPASPLLRVEGLSVEFTTGAGTFNAVEDVSFGLDEGRVLGLVGESGSGKSVTARAVMRLIGGNGRISSGKILYGGADLLKMTAEQMRSIRGNEIAMVFQDAMVAFNPVMTIGDQIREVIRQHRGMRGPEEQKRVIELLGMTGISNPRMMAASYPREFSGGMLQRAVIAMALSCDPRILIADEPTTALDSATRLQIVSLLNKLSRERSMSVMVISHDLGVVAGLADEVAVMYAGQLAERGPVDDLLTRPRHPYTKALLNSIPRLDTGRLPRLEAIAGNPPDIRQAMIGCRFAPRCSLAIKACNVAPSLKGLSSSWSAACWRADWSGL